MKQYLLPAIVTALLLLATTAFGQIPVVSTDTVWIDSIVTHSDQKVVLQVHFSNQVNLRGIDVPLTFLYPELTIDSVSFVGSRVDGKLSTIGTIGQEFAEIHIGALFLDANDEEIPPGRGLLASIYVHVPADFPNRLVPFDTTTIASSLTFVDFNDHWYVPEFRKGYLNNIFAPDLADSVWMDDVQVNSGESFSITIHALNERSLSAFSLPLTYPSDNIDFDSLSVIGTRSAAAEFITLDIDNVDKKMLAVVNFAGANSLLPGSGPIAVAHFTCAAIGTTSQVIIDTAVHNSVSLQFQLTQMDNFILAYPAFSSGNIDINLLTDADDDIHPSALPDEYSLGQNHPNPFNPVTQISFALPQQGRVKIEVFNILGEKVRTLIDATLAAGYHSIEFDGRDAQNRELASGVYFYRMNAGMAEQTRKMILLK